MEEKRRENRGKTARASAACRPNDNGHRSPGGAFLPHRDRVIFVKLLPIRREVSSLMSYFSGNRRGEAARPKTWERMGWIAGRLLYFMREENGSGRSVGHLVFMVGNFIPLGGSCQYVFVRS